MFTSLLLPLLGLNVFQTVAASKHFAPTLQNVLPPTLLGRQLENGQASQQPLKQARPPLMPKTVPQDDVPTSQPAFVFSEMMYALSAMQDNFFSIWQGRWPNASDWTGAVMSTHLGATLNTITTAAAGPAPLLYQTNAEENTQLNIDPALYLENFVGRYWSQLIGYYFGEHSFNLHFQGNDDMLWVVMEWLEGIKFANQHNLLHHQQNSSTAQLASLFSWHGLQYIPSFAHRSHVFHSLVASTWEDKLCGGGLTWNPKLKPYKNTITNTQYISASVGMYLFHPGDNNTSPVLWPQDTTAIYLGLNATNNNSSLSSTTAFLLPPVQPNDPSYLDIAIETYDWLQNINLTNEHGLYVDGYHLPENSTQCTLRNENVYTYNQGVILSGQHHLFSATRNATYLEHGHALIGNVIRATWRTDTTIGGEEGKGIMHEWCDRADKVCGQDALAFKGIWWLHFATFCGTISTDSDDQELVEWHASLCRSYLTWVELNARAVLRTKDKRGVFGQWWDVMPCDEQYDNGLLCHDPNEDGLGRTVETQAAGLAVLRAWWELLAQQMALAT